MTRACVSRMLRISRTVADLARAVAFYRDALGFRVVGVTTLNDAAWGEPMGLADGRGSSVTMRLGQQDMELVAFKRPGDLYPPASSSVDLWFQHIAVVVSSMAAAYAQLRGYAFEPISEQGPQQLPPGSGSVIAYKFRDPDGHPIELIQFPKTTGGRVQQQDGPVFLGIDHSAISIANMEQSVDFYTRLLGLRVVSRSVNSGSAQERLDRAADVLVDVVALQPAAPGPAHVELLGYKRPIGLPVPPRAKASDIFADRLVLQVDRLGEFVDMLCAKKAALAAPGIVARSGDLRTVLVRDPTGHLLQLCS